MLSKEDQLVVAAETGDAPGVEELLRNKRLDPNFARAAYDAYCDVNTETPALLVAADRGDDVILKALLNDPRVDPNIIKGFRIKNMKGQTMRSRGSFRSALMLAAENGNESMVKLLLEDKRVDPNLDDSEVSFSGGGDGTALTVAAYHGHEAIVRLLLGDNRVNPNAVQRSGRTALIYAIEQGHEGVVALLMGDKRVDPSIICEPFSDDFVTALAAATKTGSESVVRSLLGDERVDPNETGSEVKKYNRYTPLGYAARHGHEGVVKLLLGDERVDPNIGTDTTETPMTPVWIAVTDVNDFNPSPGRLEAYESIVRLLMADARTVVSGIPIEVMKKSAHHPATQHLLQLANNLRVSGGQSGGQ